MRWYIWGTKIKMEICLDEIRQVGRFRISSLIFYFNIFCFSSRTKDTKIFSAEGDIIRSEF